MGGTCEYLQSFFIKNKFTFLLLCMSLIISFYMSRHKMRDLIRIEKQNSRSVHLLVL
jgi:hypothetical protein